MSTELLQKFTNRIAAGERPNDGQSDAPIPSRTAAPSAGCAACAREP